MQTVKLSVIIPVYNVEKYLSDAIDSVINQPCKDMEIILVDDGSPDNSGKICDEYALKDSRIKVIHKENGGVSNARNAGLDAATGEYVLFFDSDDILCESIYTEELHAKMNGCETVFFDFIRGDEYCNPVYQYRTPRIYDGDKYIIVTRLTTSPLARMFFKRQVIEDEHIRFDSRFKVGEDKLFALQFAIHTNSYAIIEQPSYIYRDNSNSLMHSKGNGRALDEFALITHERQKLIDVCISRLYDERLVKHFKCMIVGMLLEFFVLGANMGYNKKKINSKVQEHGLDTYYPMINDYNFGPSILKEIKLYFNHPNIFIFKYRLKARVHRLAKIILPRRMLESIKKKIMEK